MRRGQLGGSYQPHNQKIDEYETNLAILTGLPLLSVSSSASCCASRSIRSASLLRSLARSVPVTFLPQVVWNALRAAATAMSMSFTEPGSKVIIW